MKSLLWNIKLSFFFVRVVCNLVETVFILVNGYKRKTVL